MRVSLASSPLPLHGKQDPKKWLALSGEPSTSPELGASGEPIHAVRRCDGATNLGRKRQRRRLPENLLNALPWYWKNLGSAATCRRDQSPEVLVRASCCESLLPV